MPYANETDRYKIPWWETGEISSGASNEDAALNIEWPLELINKIIAGEACDCTLGAGFQVSAGAGLSIDVAAGSGMIGGLAIYAGDITNKPSLPDDEATIYLYLKLTATTKRDRSFTVEASLSGPPLADAIYIATCTTAGGAVTVVNNSPADRTPRLPGSISGIPGLRIVAPAGAQYTDPKTAIEACIAGDLVYICAGTYTLTAAITLPANNITILGANRGAVILDFTAADSTYCISVGDKSGITIEALTIQAASGKTGNGISGSSCTDLHVENVKLTGFSASANPILASGGSRWLIRSCYIETGSRFGITLAACPDSACEANEIKVDGVSSGVSCGIQVTTAGAHRIRLIGNTIRTTAAGDRALQVWGADYIDIIGNTVTLDAPPAAGAAIKLLAYDASRSGGKILSNRIILTGGNGYGIVLETENPYTLDETDVSHNTVLNGARGISITDVRVTDTLVHGNKVATCTAGVSDAGTNTNALDQD